MRSCNLFIATSRVILGHRITLSRFRKSVDEINLLPEIQFLFKINPHIIRRKLRVYSLNRRK
jgi:hypothetical protein